MMKRDLGRNAPLTADEPVTLEVKHGHWRGSCRGHLIVDARGFRNGSRQSVELGRAKAASAVRRSPSKA